MIVRTDAPAQPWTGRDDGPGPEHLRWHNAVTSWPAEPTPGTPALIGFRSDEGVRRNRGRPGAAQGPAVLRAALASLAIPRSGPSTVYDAGDVVVDGSDLEAAQYRLGAAVTAMLDHGHPVTVLGGGHEVAYGTYLGIAGSAAVRAGARCGVLNLDAHFDLRADAAPSSGTPFLQMARQEKSHGRDLRYAVVGIAQPSNTTALFTTAAELGVRYLLDDECRLVHLPDVETLVGEFLAPVDLVHLTVDLDVLPAAVAPGVSAPAAFGVPLEVVQHVCDLVARSGRLAVAEIAELNPAFDTDNRTARTAARLVHRLVTGRHTGRPLDVP
jgi:formiminoglutamase